MTNLTGGAADKLATLGVVLLLLAILLASIGLPVIGLIFLLIALVSLAPTILKN